MQHEVSYYLTHAEEHIIGGWVHDYTFSQALKLLLSLLQSSAPYI
jgi:hypothetical protein